MTINPRWIICHGSVFLRYRLLFEVPKRRLKGSSIRRRRPVGRQFVDRLQKATQCHEHQDHQQARKWTRSLSLSMRRWRVLILSVPLFHTAESMMDAVYLGQQRDLVVTGYLLGVGSCHFLAGTSSAFNNRGNDPLSQ